MAGRNRTGSGGATALSTTGLAAAPTAAPKVALNAALRPAARPAAGAIATADAADRSAGAPDQAELALVGDAATARLALSPLRRELLARLRTPGSAASLAGAMNLPRQKVGYHLRVLEEAGLIAAVGARKRRGFTERLLEARGDALIVDPMILSPPDPDAVEKQDSFAAGHLVRTAAGIVREVSRMREAASAEGSRLLTFTLEADIGFAAPADLERFATRLSEALAALAKEFEPAKGKRLYRVTAAGHPAVRERTPTPHIN